MPLRFTRLLVLSVLFCLHAALSAQESLQPAVETRLLEMLREQSVLSTAQYEELVRLSRESAERSSLEAQIRLATDDLVARLQDQAPSTHYKPGKGFAFTTADSKVSMIVGGRIKARFTTHTVDDADTNYEFNTTCLRLWLKGHAFSPEWNYELQMEIGGHRVEGDGAGGPFESDARFTYAKEAWVCWSPDKAFNATFGLFPAPYSRALIISDSKQQFVNRWIGNDEFAPDDQMGLWLMGQFGGEKSDLIEYDLSVVNGTGLNVPENNTSLMVLGRVAVNPFGELDYTECDFGGSELTMQLGLNAWVKENDLLNASDHCVGGDVSVAWKGLYATAEVHNKTFADGSPDALGWFAQAGWMLLPGQLEFGMRHAVIDYGAVASGTARLSETLGVVGWFFDRHRLKTQLDYGLIRTTDAAGAESDDWRLRFQVQMIF